MATTTPSSNCVLVNVPKTIGSSFSSLLIMTFVAPTLMMSPAVVLSIFLELIAGDSNSGATNVGVLSLCHLPDLLAFMAKNSSMPLDLVHEDRIVDFPIGIALVELAYQMLKFAVSPKPGDTTTYKGGQADM